MQSRHLLLASASVLALSIASSGGAFADGYAPVGKGMAAPVPMRTISGTVATYYSYSSLDNEDNDVEEHPWYAGGDARVDMPLSDSVSVQIDQYGKYAFDEMTTSENFTGGYLGGLHLNKRHANHYLFGVFGGGGVNAYADTSHDQVRQWLVGVEGQYYHGNTTFYGQVGYYDAEGNDSTSQETMSNAYFLRGVARHYMNGGNTKLEGELGWMSGDTDTGRNQTTDDMDMIAWGIEIEHVIRSWGDDGFLSFYARYQGQDYQTDITGSGRTEHGSAHTVRVGFRMDLNQLNPLTRERTGAAVDLPDMDWFANSALTN